MECPVGTYSTQTGLEREEQCTDCEFGQYCDQPGMNKTSGYLLIIYFINFDIYKIITST